MVLFLILLIAAGVVVGFYAVQNTSTHDVTLFTWHWSAVPDWLPVVLTAAVIGAIFLLYMMYAGLAAGVRHGTLRRHIGSREAAIGDLRNENVRLREDNARLRSELRGMERGMAGSAPVEHEPTPAYNEPAMRSEPLDRDETPAMDRPRTAQPYRARPTFGERVRAFFTGRQPAGY